MGRFKTLASNTLIFAICNFTSKLLVFFMLPFYTAVLTKEEFGTADLIVTIVGLLLPIFSLSVSHGCMRFALDKSKNTCEVFSFGLKIIILGASLLVISTPILLKINIIKGYVFVFLLLFISHLFQSYFSLFARGIDKVRLVGVAGVVSSFVVVISNVLLLFVFHFGVSGYLWSMVISHLSAIIILFWGGKMALYFTTSRNKELSKEIINYSLPLIPNSLSWWINHSANRLILNHYCGVADVGLYSAASKMPSIIDTFRGIFVQAWQLSTITEYDKDDSSSFFSSMYKGYNLFIILICTLLITFSQLLARILYSAGFFDAWIFTPLLLVGVVFGSLVAYYSPFYLAHKKTKILFYSTAAGAVITIGMNILLIPYLGIMGAAVTSMLSNLIIYLWLHIDSRKYLDYQVNNTKYYISYLLLIVQALGVSFFNWHPLGILSLLCCATIVAININDLGFFYKMASSALKNRKTIIKNN